MNSSCCNLKKKGERVASLPLTERSSYWNTVGMLVVLLASFASPKWHWRQNCVVEGALVLPTLLMFGLYGPFTKKKVA